MDRRADHVLFAHFAGRDEEELDLAAAALLIAQIEYPDLEIAPYLERLDDMAEVVCDYADDEPDEMLPCLVRHLFDELGFRGDEESYYDPENSFLNRVLDRRLGIPITLSVVFLEVGRRVGLDVEGISFPGHFLVQCHTPDGTIVLDPYHRGTVVGREDLEHRLERVFGKRTPLRDDYLQAATKRLILTRMLNNLRLIYQRRGELELELAALERMALLNPRDPRIQEVLESVRRKATERN